jgi:hypothetical protein
MRQVARVMMGSSALAGIFLAFGWPLVIAADPASEAFHVAAVATLVAFLGSLAAVLATKR